MIGDLFDSPWKILIVAVVLIVLFGAKKLPYAARSLGQSMRILKREVQGLNEDETVPGAPAQAEAPASSASSATGFPQAELAPAPQAPMRTAPQPDQQSQIDALQQQIRDLQRAAAMDPVPADAPRTQQPS
jgi:sec-independent protein translocase protein TatA